MNRKGFTLIELIITIALMGIVFSIAIPRINMDFGKLDSITNELVYDIRYIRQENMKGNENYKIEFSGGRSYHIFKVGTSSSTSIKSVSCPDGYRFVLPDTRYTIDFSVNGLNDVGSISTVSIVKVNSDGSIKKGSTKKTIDISNFGAITTTTSKIESKK